MRVSVLRRSRKEGVLAIIGPSDYFGEDCLAEPSIPLGTATAITPTTILVIDEIEVLRVVHLEHDVEPTRAKDY